MLPRHVWRCIHPRLLATRQLSTTPLLSRLPVLAICREETSVWERRAPLNPNHVKSLVKKGIKVLVQPSMQRAYFAHEYEAAGAIITEDITKADTIVGVKSVPIDSLIEDKTYVFFSHTIKAQKENMPLLDALLEKGIRLVDYERLLDSNGVRLVAFGKYAGVAGMINILHGLGLRLLALGYHTPLMHVGAAHNYASSSAAKAAIYNLGREIQLGLLPEALGPMVFTFTGSGNVSKGAQEVFQELPNEFVSPTSLKDVVASGDSRKVYATVVSRGDHLVRKDGGKYDAADFDANPQEYASTFAEQIVPYTTCLINGVFWAPDTPRLMTTEQCKGLHPREFDPLTNLRSTGVPKLPQRLLAIADVSCDMQGSLEFMTKCTTIDNPFLLYNAHTDDTTNDMSGNGILILSIENLPAQIPREATDYFGSRLSPFITDFLRMDGKLPLNECTEVSRAVRDAVISYNGDLTDGYKYIAELRKRNEQQALQ